MKLGYGVSTASPSKENIYKRFSTYDVLRLFTSRGCVWLVSMNSTGKELSQADLIRNFILSG